MTDLHPCGCEICRSMQSNMEQMRSIVKNCATTKTTTKCHQTNWIRSSFRSITHCYYHRLYAHLVRCLRYIYILMVTLFVVSLVILSQQSNLVEFIKQLPSAFNDFNCNPGFDSNIASPQLLTNLAQQIARIEDDMETVKAQRTINLDSLHENISNQCANSTLILTQEISLLKEQLSNVSSTKSQRNSNGKTKMIKDHNTAELQQKLHNKVFKMEANLSAEMVLLQNELNTIKHRQQQSTTALTQTVTLLQQQIEHLEQSDRDNLNYQKTVDVWDKFMLQQNELNQKFLDLLDSTPSREQNPGDTVRADFAVRAVYHTELMTSSMMEHWQGKLYYFVTRNYDQNAVKPTGRIGDCTPLKQNDNQNVYIILRLRQSMFVNGITIEYIRPSLAQNKITSAPKNMTLELSQDGYHYYKAFSGYLLYNPLVDGAKKYFEFSVKTKHKYQFAKLNVLSNHGAEYSCIYRVQIHGVVD
eukprot:39763_1